MARKRPVPFIPDLEKLPGDILDEPFEEFLKKTEQTVAQVDPPSPGWDRKF